MYLTTTMSETNLDYIFIIILRCFCLFSCSRTLTMYNKKFWFLWRHNITWTNIRLVHFSNTVKRPERNRSQINFFIIIQESQMKKKVLTKLTANCPRLLRNCLLQIVRISCSQCLWDKASSRAGRFSIVNSHLVINFEK
jgi:hypothetical protein